MESLCSVMIQMLKSQAAPDVDIDKFDGTMVEYPTFRTSFKEAVDSTVDDQRGRLNRLIKYTIGEPKELVSGFILDNTGCCYDNAIQALDKEYGDKSRIASAFMKELRQWHSIRSSDAKGFRQMHRFLLKCKVMQREGHLMVLDSAENIQ